MFMLRRFSTGGSGISRLGGIVGGIAGTLAIQLTISLQLTCAFGLPLFIGHVVLLLTLLAVPQVLGRDPVGALPRLHMLDVHGVDLLQGATVRLIDEEVGDDDAEPAASAEDVAVLKIDLALDERSKKSHEEVPGPVGQRGKTDAQIPVSGRVEFSADGPD